MQLIHEFKDDIYPRDEIVFEKHAARAIVFNQEGKVALIRCLSKEYGMDCYLTPGGGIESGETPEDAVKREVLEEIGFACEIRNELGMIIDYFYDIKRKTVSYYFIVQVVSQQLTQRTETEKKFIQGVAWLTIPEAISLLETYPADPRGSTFHRRDLLAMKKAAAFLILPDHFYSNQ